MCASVNGARNLSARVRPDRESMAKHWQKLDMKFTWEIMTPFGVDEVVPEV
jgi:hypothetical protein